MVSTEKEDGINREGGWHQQRGRMVSTQNGQEWRRQLTEKEDGINREGGWYQQRGRMVSTQNGSASGVEKATNN